MKTARKQQTRKPVIFSIRVSREMHDQLKTQAAEHSQNPSEYIRTMIEAGTKQAA